MAVILGLCFQLAYAQQEPGPFDFGKMWTFENPPKDWFKTAYGYDLDQNWFDEGRESALRFASWCSASFVSPDGLVMTNHHCSESVVSVLQKEGENFDKEGFYAATLADERRNEEVFVEQLIKVADATAEINNLIGKTATDEERLAKMQQAIGSITSTYQTKPGWENLRIQIVPYYSGAKYSVYGYKRYDDVRLVFLPETQLGFFGGDPDNFTYPRYNLDCTFWRVYENGQPLNTSGNYFKFNTDGVKDGTPVFVIGNPGTTERYRTVSQLEFDRDYRYPVDIEFYENRMKLMQEEYKVKPTDELRSDIFGLSNSLKAIKGTLSGLKDPDLFARKVKMEQRIRKNAGDKKYWDEMVSFYNELSKYSSELRFLTPTPISSAALPYLYGVNQYYKLASENPESPELEEMRKNLIDNVEVLQDPKAGSGLAMVLGELNKFAGPEDTYLKTVLDGRTPQETAAKLLHKSDFGSKKDLEKFLDKDVKKFLKTKDPVVVMANNLYDEYGKAVNAFQSTGAKRKQIEAAVAGEAFKVFGDKLPPDATFTLRISDGIVKSYNYNGTQAPIKTTYYGLYDRYESNNGQFPWSLPSKWTASSPNPELLKAPINFICTADIIGGNSGSPVINVNREVVGLVFDGNIESLPGKFIFDEENNRTVAVHAGGIVAALRYVYRADRLVQELTK